MNGIHVSKPSRLRLVEGMIVVAQETGDVFLPLRNIEQIIIDEQRLRLTPALMQACAQNGIDVKRSGSAQDGPPHDLPFHRDVTIMLRAAC